MTDRADKKANELTKEWKTIQSQVQQLAKKAQQAQVEKRTKPS